jgi:hypothetical protein
VNHSAGPFPEGFDPLRVMSIPRAPWFRPAPARESRHVAGVESRATHDPEENVTAGARPKKPTALHTSITGASQY